MLASPFSTLAKCIVRSLKYVNQARLASDVLSVPSLPSEAPLTAVHGLVSTVPGASWAREGAGGIVRGAWRQPDLEYWRLWRMWTALKCDQSCEDLIVKFRFRQPPFCS
eukprot:12498967-Alexandrium_andersonii.AAC.1